MIVLSENDFIEGFYKVPSTQYTKVYLTEAIANFEKVYLCELLGVELADLYIADLLNGVPQTQRFLDIHNPFVKEICDIQEQSLGIKKYLQGSVYCEVMTNRNYVVTEGGNVSNQKENSSMLDFHNNVRIAELRYNVSKFTADAIKKFIRSENETYPEFKDYCIKIKYNALI